jgi:Acetyltransferase (GNAT) domain
VHEHELQARFLEPGAPMWRALLHTMRHDIYHLPQYACFAARRQEIGVPLAFVAQEPGGCLLVPLIVRRIPREMGDGLYDAISPRGFPGPLLGADPSCDPGFVDRAVEALADGLRSRQIVTAYLRLHPLLPPPVEALRRVGAVVEHGDSVSIDLTLSPEELGRQTRTNHRRDINKATRLGYVARIDETWQRLDAFVAVYQQSMERLGADVFWRLSRDYFSDLRESLDRNVHLCIVELRGEVAAGGILTEEDGIVEYHLAGTADAHVAASPSKLVIDFARRWAQERGNRSLHLAGASRRGDSLSHFKSGFSPLLHPVYSWRLVADTSAYGLLVDRWQGRAQVAADPPEAFFPAYRKLGPGPR